MKDWKVADAYTNDNPEREVSDDCPRLVTQFIPMAEFETFKEAEAFTIKDLKWEVGRDYCEDYESENGNEIMEFQDGNGKYYCIYHVSDEEEAKKFMQRNF